MMTHRGSRWCFSETYARLLVKHGYRGACTVTPGLSWKAMSGRPDGLGGSDYTSFPVSESFLDLAPQP